MSGDWPLPGLMDPEVMQRVVPEPEHIDWPELPPTVVTAVAEAVEAADPVDVALLWQVFADGRSLRSAAARSGISPYRARVRLMALLPAIGGAVGRTGRAPGPSLVAPPPSCRCGCGATVRSMQNGVWSQFIQGHNRRARRPA